MADLTSILTLNWGHHSDLTGPFIRYVDQFTEDYELIVVDQEVLDLEKLLADGEQFRNLRIIASAVNLGFPAGNNLALTYARGEYICVMNNDIQISGFWLPRLVEAASDRNTIAGASLIRAGGWNEFDVKGFRMVIPYLEGWLLVFHRSILSRMGETLFREDFREGGMEDVDFCRRAARAGIELKEIPHLPLVHLRGRTVTDGRLRQDQITLANYKTLLGELHQELPGGA